MLVAVFVVSFSVPKAYQLKKGLVDTLLQQYGAVAADVALKQLRMLEETVRPYRACP
jgi:hypothetical protein